MSLSHYLPSAESDTGNETPPPPPPPPPPPRGGAPENPGSIECDTLLEVIEANPVVFYTCGLTAGYTVSFISANVRTLTGFGPEEFVGAPDFWAARIHPEDGERVLRDADRARIDGHVSLEYRWQIRDGSYRWMRDEAYVVRDDQSGATLLAGCWFDITDRRRAEDAARESEERFRLLLDSAGEAIFGVDPEGRATFCNAACLRLLGYARGDDLLGKRMHDVVHHSHADGTPMPFEECPVEKSLLGGTPFISEDDLLWRADGTSFHAEVRAHPLVRNGKLIGAVVSFIDVSRRRLLEEEVRQAQKMEVVARLAGGVAHEFNNLLTVIRGHADLALEEGRDARALRQHVEEVRRAADRAAVLTRQLLAFGQRQVAAPKLIDLGEVVRDAEGLLRRLVGEDVALLIEVGSRPAVVRADPGQVEQVLVNLALNSRDAMPRGGTLSIEATSFDVDPAHAGLHPSIPPGRYVRLSVADTGCGMSPETMSHLFEPFFTTKEKGQGTGLGLSTIYGIVKGSGGFLEVESEVGRGTTFRIYLPPGTEGGPAKEAPATADAPGAVRTILVVEDEEIVRELTRRILVKHGYHVLVARDGAEALAVASRHSGAIPLTVTDVVMPGMSGRVLAQRLAEGRPEMKVLYVSGYTAGALNDLGEMERQANFLPKPFSPADLVRKVRDILGEG